MSESVNAPSCSYASLKNYNASHGTMGHPQVPPTNVNGVYIVPDYAPIGYNSLSHNAAPSCAGYFDISSAYGHYDNKNGWSNGWKNGCGTRYLQQNVKNF